MQIAGSVALVTGANRGIGRRFASALLERGAAKVYATARDPHAVDLAGVEVLSLDVTDPGSVAAAATAASDVTLLINNAGVATYTNLVDGDLAKLRLEMETHYFGTLNVVRAFAPVLRAGGGGAVLNMLSALSYVAYDGANGYAAAKAAQWSLTNGIRLELAAQGTLVTGLVVAAVDTDMMAGSEVPKHRPEDVARAGLDAVEAGVWEVLVDEASVQAKAGAGTDPRIVYGQAVGAA